LITHALQLAEDMEQNGGALWVCPLGAVELCAEYSLHVFEENKGRSPQLSESSEDVGEQVSGVIVTCSLPCGAKWLTREASRDDVHFSVKLGPWESLKIRPDRCEVQESRLHFRNQVRAGVRLDLTKSDRAHCSESSLQSDVNAAVSSAK